MENKIFVDGSHNPLGAKVLNEYLESLDCNKHIILGMMANKDHNEYMRLRAWFVRPKAGAYGESSTRVKP